MIIKHRAMCPAYRWDSKVSTLTQYTRFCNGYNVTVLALLSRQHVPRSRLFRVATWNIVDLQHEFIGSEISKLALLISHYLMPVFQKVLTINLSKTLNDIF